MKWKEKLLDLASQFQNTKIRGSLIQLGYFIIAFACRIPILSAFGLIPCKLFSKFQFNFLKIPTQNSQSELLKTTGQIVIATYLIALLLLVGLFLKKRKELESKLLVFALMAVQALNNLAYLFLIEICARSDLLVLQLISGSLLVVFQTPMIIMDKILITYEGNKQNAFSHKNNNPLLVIKTLQRLIFYITIFMELLSNNSVAVNKAFYAILACLYSVRIYRYIKTKYYIQNISHFLQVSGTSICLILLVLINFYEISEQPLLRSNFPHVCTIVVIFACISIYSYAKHMENQILFMQLEEVVTNQKIIPYIMVLYRLWKDQGLTINSYLISSFRKNHEISCKDVNCQCKISQQNKQTQANSKFLQNYLKQIFRYFLNYTKNNADPDVVFQILFFRLEMFDEIFLVNQKLQQLKNSSNEKEISNEVVSYILRKKLQQITRKKNYSNIAIDAIAVINLQQKIDEIQKIILSDIRIKKHKWKYLCQHICKSSDIQEDIEQEITNIISFQKIYHQNKQNYMKNLTFNALSLFYYGSIVFFKKEISNIQKNLIEIISAGKNSFLNEQKQLEHSIFNHKCCLIEFNIQLKGQSSEDFQLSINNCNKNVINVFKQDKFKMIGSKIEVLFPPFLSVHMKQMISKYFQSKKFYNSIQSYFYIDSFGHVFEGLTCIKILPRNDTIQCVIFILKKQSQNIILLNKKGLIENVGSVYIQNFGSFYNKVPFSSLFLSPQEYENINFLQVEETKRVSMIDSSQLKQGWKIFLVNASEYTKKEESKSLMSIELSKRNTSQSKLSYKKYYEFLRNQRKLLIQAKKKNDLSDSKTNKTLKNNLGSLTVYLRYKKFNQNNLVFFMVTFQQLEKRSLLQQTFQQKRLLKSSLHHPNCHQIEYPNNIEGKQFQSKVQNEVICFQNSIVDQVSMNGLDDFHQALKSEDNFIMEKNSIHSSINNESMIHFNNRFIEICFKLFRNPEEINDRRLKWFTINSLLFSFVFVVLLVGSHIVFQLNLGEVKDIFFADGAVSDNMQLTQFIYNRALNFKLFRENQTHLESIKKSASFQREYLYNLLVYDLDNYIVSKTSMSKTKFYQYIQVPVLWKNSYHPNDQVQIKSNQFLVFYKLLSMQVQQSMKSRDQQMIKDLQKSLTLMKVNFPQLKRINHGNLFLYKELSDDSLDLVGNLFLFLSISHVFLSIVVFLAFVRQKLFRRYQQVQGYSIYRIIPSKIIEILSSYYEKHALENQTESDLIKYENDLQSSGLTLVADSKAFLKPNKSVFISNNHKSPLAIWKMLLVLFIMNGAYGLLIFNINQLVQPIKSMMKNLNDLMDSENYLLEAYFDLKANFIVSEGMDLNMSYFEDLLQHQLESEVIFNKISVQSLTLFSNYDPNFSSEFIHLLINDACDIAQKDLSLSEHEKCKTFFKLNFLKNGVTMGMNYFTRKVRETITEVKQNVKSLSQSGYNTQYIRSSIISMFKNDAEFKQIDESIFFMFKLYQRTQAKIYDSLEKTIISTMKIGLAFVIVEILLIGALYPLNLYLNHRKEKNQLSKLYVSFLLIPTPVSQFIKAFSSKIQHILEYD